MTQIKNKKRQAISGGKDYSVRHFTSTLTAREIPKTQGKNPDKMCQLNFLKIYPQLAEAMINKSSMYLLGMLIHIENFLINERNFYQMSSFVAQVSVVL